MILHGDCIALLSTLPEKSVQMCVTSNRRVRGAQKPLIMVRS